MLQGLSVIRSANFFAFECRIKSTVVSVRMGVNLYLPNNWALLPQSRNCITRFTDLAMALTGTNASKRWNNTSKKPLLQSWNRIICVMHDNWPECDHRLHLLIPAFCITFDVAPKLLSHQCSCLLYNLALISSCSLSAYSSSTPHLVKFIKIDPKHRLEKL